ncbi:MAG: DUF805 domain-containing protein [Parvularcula sp.]
MKDAFHFMVDTSGRASRRAMVLISLVFLTVGMVRAQLVAQGAMAAGATLLVAQLLLVWPAQIAVPIRRMHDMGRRGFWIAIFWGGAVLGGLFIYWGLAQSAAFFDLTVPSILKSPSVYIDKIVAFNADRPETEQITALNATAMGGFSLAMIFLIIQFGWLHLIPGTTGGNESQKH